MPDGEAQDWWSGAAEAALHAAGIGIWEWTRSTRQVRGDRCFRALFGLAPEPDPVSEDVYWSNADPASGLDAARKTLGETGRFELGHRVIRPDGEVRWVLWRGRRRSDDPDRVTGIVTDASDRTEAPGLGNELLYRAVAEQLPNGAVFVVDRELRYRMAEGSALSTTGFEPSDFLNRTVRDVVGDALAPHYESLYGDALAGRAFRDEHEAYGRHYVSHGVPLRNRAGAVEAVLAVSYDLTDRKQGEDALRASVERLRQLGDSLPLMLAWLSSDGRAEYVNPRFAEYTVIPHGPSGWRSLVHPDDLDRVVEIWRKGVGSATSFELECRIRRASDGQFRWLWVQCRCHAEEPSRVSHWILVAQDVHDRHLAEAGLKEEERRKDEFLAVLAHELRNPLAPIRHALHLLRRAHGPEVDRAGLYTLMERQLAHVVHLVDDLLDVSRIRHGKIGLRRKPTVLGDVVRSAVEASRPLFTAAGQQLVVSAPDDAIVLDADPVRLVQVFSNLLTNASKYTESGGTVTVACTGSDREVDRPRVGATPEVGAPLLTETEIRLRILVVDDNRESADSLALLLRFSGAEVWTGCDGVSALEAFERHRPEVAILDIGMPTIDGHEVARRIRRLEGGDAPTLVALTGWGQEEDHRRSREAGFDHHFVKPTDLDALFALLQRVATRA